jgi:UPF0755 protein
MTRHRGWDADGTQRDESWERTAPPWEPAGWNDAIPPQRGPGDQAAHPSGPLPRVPSDSWPPGYGEGPGGYTGTRRRREDPGAPDGASYRGTGYLGPGHTGPGYGTDPGDGGAGPRYGPTGYGRSPYGSGRDAGYPASVYQDRAASRGSHARDHPLPGPGAAGRGEYPAEPGYGTRPGRHGGAGYAPRTGYGPGPGYGPSPGYGAGYEDDGGYGTGGHGAGDADYGADGADAGYRADPGYGADADYGADAGYGAAGGYGGDAGYGADAGYAGDAGHGADAGYAAGAGYGAGPGRTRAGYRTDDAGYPPDEHNPAPEQPYHDGYGDSPRVAEDDHGYGGDGDWYGDVAEDQAWADDGGFLAGLGADEARARGAAREPGPHPRPAAPRRPRAAKTRRKSVARRAAPWIALTVLVLVLAVGGGGFYYVWSNFLHPPDYSGPGTGTVTVHIEPGETATDVGQQLVKLGVVASVRAFANAAKASGHGSSLQPGYYRLHRHMSAALAFALLLKPSSRIQLSVTIPEGLRLSNIIAVLGKHTGDPHGYRQAIRDTSALGLPSYAHGNPEGFLFPATYNIQPGTSPLQVLRAMVQRYDQEAASAGLAAMAARDRITEDEAIIVASLVQAEGRRPQDFPKIASVIYNRLNAKMPLQLDSTVMYALRTYGIRASSAQTKVNSPYNTYLHTGLPPGPIDSPGDAAIRAALHPAHGGWFYFLTVNPRTGLTKFTNSYSVFQTYLAELNANLAKGR